MGVGKVPDETKGSRKRAQMVTMTTLWAAPTKHWHIENLSGVTCRCLPRQTSKQEGAGGKNSSAAQKQKSGG